MEAYQRLYRSEFAPVSCNHPLSKPLMPSEYNLLWKKIKSEGDGNRLLQLYMWILWTQDGFIFLIPPSEGL